MRKRGLAERERKGEEGVSSKSLCSPPGAQSAVGPALLYKEPMLSFARYFPLLSSEKSREDLTDWARKSEEETIWGSACAWREIGCGHCILLAVMFDWQEKINSTLFLLNNLHKLVRVDYHVSVIVINCTYYKAIFMTVKEALQF